MRIALFAASAWLFGRTWVYFKVWHVHRRMPLLVGFGLVAAFIWLAENIGTVTRVWLYPKQAAAWSPVAWQKFGSWFLLMIVSYVLVTLVSRPRAVRRSAREADGAGLGADGTASRIAPESGSRFSGKGDAIRGSS